MTMTATHPSESRPAASLPTDATHSEGSLAIRQPLVWLAVILLIGLGLRCWRITYPLQLDEFGPLYAVAEREGLKPGWMPTDSNPLMPIGSWSAVRDRSVLPYGIVNPLPLYHWLLYGIFQFCPITEWSLRLPSLLAGLGCIAAVYFLCRRLLGVEAALVAALLTAVDPMQVVVSDMARPYAIGNLACVFSFWGLLGILCSHSTAGRTAATVGYALAITVIGAMNPILLLVVIAHLGMIAYWWFGRPREEAALAALPPDDQPPFNADAWAFNKAPPRSASQVLFWLVGCALAIVLLLPQLGYFLEIRTFSAANHEYLFDLQPRILRLFLYHNSTFLVALVAVSLATLAMKQLSGNGQLTEEEEKAEADSAGKPVTPSREQAGTPDRAAQEASVPSSPQPENPDLLWLGRCWLFLPQVLLVLLGYFMQINSSRYFSYVTLGGCILLAYWATRDRSRDVRLGVVGVVALTMFLWGFTDWSLGGDLITGQDGYVFVKTLDELEEKGSWKQGDLVLYRSSFLEADFLPDRIPPANREHIEQAMAAPITTLYASKSPRPYVLLSLSHRRNDGIRTKLGKHYDPSAFYTAELAGRIGEHNRFWVLTAEWNREGYLASLIPWLANNLHWDLKVARKRPDPERYFYVASGSRPEGFIAGLDNARTKGKDRDFLAVILVQKSIPSGGFSLGACGATLTPNSQWTVPVWLATQMPTPYPTLQPAEGELLDGSQEP